MGSQRTIFKSFRKGDKKQRIGIDLKKRLKKQHAIRPPLTRCQRNLKYIERSQEAILAQRRRIEAERKYRQKTNVSYCGDTISSSDTDEEEEDEPAKRDDGPVFEHLAKEFNDQIRKAAVAKAFENEEEDLEDKDEEKKDFSNDEQSDSSGQQLDRLEEQESEDDLEEVPNGFSSDDEDDPYMLHTAFNLCPAMLFNNAAEPRCVERTKVMCRGFGRMLMELPQRSTTNKKPGMLFTLPDDSTSEAPINWCSLHVKDKIARNINEPFDVLQRDMFALLNGYQDLYFAQRTFENAHRLRYVYCLHSLNHVVKAFSKVQHHTLKMAKSRRTMELEYRDQGFVRTKVLIVVPFRESAFQCVSILKRLFTGGNEKNVLHWKRFTEEYGTGSTLHFPRKNPKPLDYEQTFAGNIDDNFRLGIAFNRSTMKLYTKYCSSDVIITSPLGLRLAIGAKGEKHRDYDFLSSIELLIIDQAEVCYAQNWDHLLHLMEHLHHAPKNTEYTDFSRVREWCLSGWSKFYRQSVLLSAFELPEFRSLYNKHFQNYRGKVRTIVQHQMGAIRQVIVSVSQNFQRIETTTLDSAGSARFFHFINFILPQARTATMARCMIYVPSYFDFVRLRNHFKKEQISFTQICEYTTDAKIARAKDMFFHGSKHFLLYSERAHFFRRHRIRGVRHLIFYGPPAFPHFYPELVNLMMRKHQNRLDGVDQASMTVTVLYTRYDSYQLTEMVGIKQTKAMIMGPRSVHRFWIDQK